MMEKVMNCNEIPLLPKGFTSYMQSGNELLCKHFF
jgi:hypothetical protein